ncbi:hypothetical protein, partial [Tautonia rosea]|uniref:hypothetical protein n=1 Tax=Tautonia rosea TaxID=2728037 RepID=UPI00147580E3
ALVQAIAEADGAIVSGAEVESTPVDDPTLGTLIGAELVGSRGYGCISCHVWNGRQLSQPDPGALGPDLTRVAGRIRRDWFDQFVQDPSRFSPGTPMPAIFPEGRTTLTSVLDGDATRQRDALWAYFTLGSDAPAPQAPPPVPLEAPGAGEPVLVAQIPIVLPDQSVVESMTMLNDRHDLVVYDLADHSPRAAFVGGRLLRTVQGRTRQFHGEGEPAGPVFLPGPSWTLIADGVPGRPIEWQFQGYDRLQDGMRVRSLAQLASGPVEFEDSVRIVRAEEEGRLERVVRVAGLPQGVSLVLRLGDPSAEAFSAEAVTGTIEPAIDGNGRAVRLIPDLSGSVFVILSHVLIHARSAPVWEGTPLEQPDLTGGDLERPGYRAVAFPRPKTVSGEDRVMPAALAVDPVDGSLFVSSLKTGELFVVDDPRGDPSSARFTDYSRGLFQDAFSMLAGQDGLSVLHRRNLTRASDTDGDGRADRFDRVAALPHGVADTYDYAYGLVRDREGGFILSYAPYANTSLPGSGGVLRIVPGREPEELAFGLRNPLGWCSGPDGEVFFTDNQGEWVASNKLCHVERGKFYGFPNPGQPEHAEKPAGRPAVWVPYAWGRSINGVAYDNTGGKFGPFSGQFFLAELMYGGAIVRANVERVNGQYQGACFPFWGEGLLGPVSLAFDPAGHLYVGGITEPGWMAQPDRGALFRVDFTGETPFEMQSIHAMPRGFRIVFTAPIDEKTAAVRSSYHLERYRYEYTGAYGSPELDRSEVGVERILVAPDRMSVELTTEPLVQDHVYLIDVAGVHSESGASLVHAVGAYTLNEIPGKDSP